MSDRGSVSNVVNINRPDLADFYKEEFVYDRDMPIWFGRYGDDFWPFTRPTDRDHSGCTSSSIVWRDFQYGRGSLFGHHSSARYKYNYRLTPSIIDDLKIAAATYSLYPRLLNNSKNCSENTKPITVKGRIDVLAAFISFLIGHVRESRGLEITKLSEIEFSDIKECVSKFDKRGDVMLRALRLISDPFIQSKLSEKLQWSTVDINSKSVVWNAAPDKGGFQPLTNDQFIFLMKRCSKHIAEFKLLMHMDIVDKYIKTDELLEIRNKYPDFISAYHDYFQIKKADSELTYAKYQKTYGYSASSVAKIITNAHSASMLVVLFLTAMRRSEVAQISIDSLVSIRGYRFIVSSVTKKRKLKSEEQWLATELTVDAYEILNMLAKNAGNKYVFSSFNEKMSYGETGGYTFTHINTKIKGWVESFNDNDLFSDCRFHIHQCRETLVYQLARNEVKLPFISMQVKHFSSRLSKIPNDVTTGYGNYKRDILNDVQNKIALAREDAFLEIYGEGAVLAGGGAPALAERIDSFFVGIKLHGAAREEFVRRLSHSGASLFPTSIGSCFQNMTDPAEASVRPCFGDFQCSPDCPVHVLSKSGCETIELRRDQALYRASSESDPNHKSYMLALADQLQRHLNVLSSDRKSDMV